MTDEIYTDVSLDLETLGTAPGSVITQIGACAFSIDGALMRTKNFYVDPQSCLDLGMTVSWSTIKWWLGQSEEARTEMQRDGIPICDALSDFASWLATYTTLGARVWGHGSNFDVTLIEDAFRRCRHPVPWHYRNVRDLRTLAMLAPEVAKPEATTPHLACADAQAQAEWIRALVQDIQGRDPFTAVKLT